MILSTPSEAGPSRKPSAPHPSTAISTNKRQYPPPLPPISKSKSSSTPTLPLKTLQGVSKTRTDSTKDGFGREVVFVTRKTGLGMLMGRCRSLVVDEGYTSLRLHAIGAAIPQALLLLHALLDLLPYPTGEKGMWYEIKTGSVECIDEIPPSTSKISEKEDDAEAEEGMEWLKDVGALEEDKPERKIRIKSTIQIDLHISPRPTSKRKSVAQPNDQSVSAKKTKTSKRNRPSKKKRQQLASKRVEERALNDEEEMMNIQNDHENGNQTISGTIVSSQEEEEEEIEEIEMR
ncbi:hypothetical protein L486_05157 [Kwoniella mangroviensis CBS 10435]|uniref:Uncharacterized protein n=1 Tax=Kwoniella mangroviensis CBS 10435 TaxID=1331196 RepID=A0A1B9IQL0_9TREE|nr:hypothetical protein L486_05157 [Kwoniella mangroviensis CBS 10435]